MSRRSAFVTSRPTTWLLFVFASWTITACDSAAGIEDEPFSGASTSATTADAQAPVSNGDDPPALYARFSDAVTVYRDGDTVILRSNGVPDHPSPYFGTSDARYQAYDGDNARFQLNPNRIAEQSYTFRVPAEPREASRKEATPLGAIGIAVNGVAIYNQYAGPNQPLTREIDSFDQFNGHPQQMGAYHYHVEPLSLTVESREALIGVLLDGFPVYGPEENGMAVTNARLDEYHGHFGPTADFPDGIYHYHVTEEDPYINGAGFFGTAGTVSQ